MSQDKPVLWISVKARLPERGELIWLWYPGMERPEICLGRRARVLHDVNEANALESDEWWMPAVVPSPPHNDHEPPQVSQSKPVPYFPYCESTNCSWPQCNCIEPPQVSSTASHSVAGADHPRSAGPASGSPDAVIGRLERLRTHQADYEEIEETAAKAQEAIRALEDEIDEVDGVCNRLAEHNQSLQHQLAQRGEWLREALDEWDKKSPGSWPRIATIRKALGEI